MEKEMINKKATLDKLYYDVGKQQYDFFIAGTYKKDGKNLFTKWKKYREAVFPIDFNGKCEDWKKQKFFEAINQRQIFPFEIVLDVEEPEQIEEIIKTLKSWGSNYNLWETGSRGYHIHIFCKKEFNEKEKMAIVKKLGTDIQKCSEKNLIALENCPHWKTGKPKTLITSTELKESAEKILNDVGYEEEVPKKKIKKEIKIKTKPMRFEDYGK